MATDTPGPVGAQADRLADQTLNELAALDAALEQVNTLPIQPLDDKAKEALAVMPPVVAPEPAPEVAAQEADAMPLERRKELAGIAAGHIADIVKQNEEALAAPVVAEPQPAAPPASAAPTPMPEEEIARIKASLNS